MEKHLRSCEKSSTQPAKQQLHQTTVDGPTSSENGHSTPKKLMVDEVQYTEHWKAPETVESVIKGQTRANTEAIKWHLSLNMTSASPQALATRRIQWPDQLHRIRGKL